VGQPQPEVSSDPTGPLGAALPICSNLRSLAMKKLFKIVGVFLMIGSLAFFYESNTRFRSARFYDFDDPYMARSHRQDGQKWLLIGTAAIVGGGVMAAAPWLFRRRLSAGSPPPVSVTLDI